MEFTAEVILRRLVLLGLPLVAVACGTGQKCPAGCPATYLTATIAVTTTPAVVLNGVDAVLTGPVTATMVCQPNNPALGRPPPNSSTLLCSWPAGVAVVAGIYSLQVAAPGYETTTVQVEVAIPPPECGCSLPSITPSTVSISPTDAGVD